MPCLDSREIIELRIRRAPKHNLDLVVIRNEGQVGIRHLIPYEPFLAIQPTFNDTQDTSDFVLVALNSGRNLLRVQ